ncbi:MAG: ATP-binding protein [Thalassobaculaceae bacterium]|uniref:ATP-binding protein n=1 Tax=Roseitalea porphyridii TaxID=1852022 RepID=UPI0032F09326
MNAEMRRGEAAFAPRARLLKLLGGELIRDDVMAVMELIKNAYDADAKIVEILVNAEDADAGEIVVSDDGNGMGVEELVGRWMQPGGSFKRRHRSTHLGRRVLGEKGVGRFAVDRLGSKCELVSRRAGSDLEIMATFDWDAFDDETMALSEIRSSWLERTPEVFIDGSGTRLRITGLRQDWSRRDFRRLCSRMQRLRSPFIRPDGFDVRISSDDFPDYTEEFGEGYLSRSPYRLTAEFDGNVSVRYDFNGQIVEMPAPALHDWSCGPVRLHMHAFDLDTESLKRAGGVQNVRAWLRSWAGCALYRDGFRVLPYGEPDDDWLRLDQRRVNNPVHRLGTAQIVGQVEITGQHNPLLKDQTNRGGLVENQAFQHMRSLVLHMIDFLEDRRGEIRHGPDQLPSPERQATGGQEDAVQAAIRTVRRESRSVSQKAGVALSPMLDVVERAYTKERQRRAGALEGLVDMAGAALSGGIFTMEMLNIAADLEREIGNLENTDAVNSATTMELRRLAQQIGDLAGMAQRFGTAVRYGSGELDIRYELNDFVHTVGGIARRLGVEVTFDNPQETLPLVSGQRDSLWQILAILLRNSIEAFGDRDEKKIRFSASAESSRNGEVSIRCADNGPGIDSSVAGRIFDEGVSTKTGHSGLGLPVARSIAERMFRRAGAEHGRLVLRNDRWRGKWTVFALMLPIYRSGQLGV